ncbi:MAG: tetratricopeptide repeat protein [Candidatus Kariarchaeaceae archaeon]|jgi:tetratricopeptide (TPR) repeat protein
MGITSIDHIEGLIDKGEYSKALEDINELSPEYQLEGKILTANIYRREEDIGKSSELLTEIEQKCQEQDNEIFVKFLLEKANVLRDTGDLDDSLKHIEKGFNILMKQELNQYNIFEASLLALRGAVICEKGDIERGFQDIQKGLKGSEKIGNKYLIAKSLYNTAEYYVINGNLDVALDYHQKGLRLYEELGDPRTIAISLTSIGLIHNIKGELDIALEYYQKCLKCLEKIGNTRSMAYALNAIAYLHQFLGEFDIAFEYIQKGLKVSEEIGNPVYIGLSLLVMIKTVVHLDKKTQGQKYLKQFTELMEKYNMGMLQPHYKFANALILKSSDRMRLKAQAQEILQEIINEEFRSYFITVLAICDLCELNIFELKSSESVEVLNETIDLVSKLYEVGQDQHMYWVIIEALILQSKLALLKGKLSQAQDYLQQAEMIAVEKKLAALLKKVEKEKNELAEQFTMWQALIEENRSIGDLMAQSRIQEYIKHAMQLKQ